MTSWKWQWIWPSRMTIKHVHNNFHQTWSFFWELQLIFLSRSRFSIPNFSQVSLLPVALRLLGKGHPRTGGRQQLGLTVSTKHGDILWGWQHDKMGGDVWIWNQLFFDMLFGFVWKWVLYTPVAIERQRTWRLTTGFRVPIQFRQTDWKFVPVCVFVKIFRLCPVVRKV